MTTEKIRLPPKLIPVFKPARGEVQYRCAYGGRGSGKSFSFALMAAVFGYVEPLRILCTRELQVSIKESFYAELKNAIQSIPWLNDAYEIGESFIRGHNGTEFMFRGLRHNMSSVKSTAQIDLTIVEEAEDVPEKSWEDLEPTVLRRDKSEIWVIWNPRKEDSPVDKRFIKNPPSESEARIVKLNYYDNPAFPEGLEKKRQRDRERLDPSRYAHIWEGDYLRNSDAQVFANCYRVKSFLPKERWNGPYQGLDFGFSQDPTAAVKCWEYDGTLYIEYEAGKTQLSLDDTAMYILKRIPEYDKNIIRADSARPESIHHLKGKGLPHIRSVEKWQGSVEDGIEFMKAFKEIIIHPRCKETINEFNLYSYKCDKNTDEPTDKIVDEYNHYIDAIRYAIAPMIKKRGGPRVLM